MSHYFLALIVFMSLGVSTILYAKPKVGVDIEVSQSYTDNIQQDSENGDGSRISEFSTGISLSDQGAKTDYSLRLRHLNIDFADDSVEDRKENSGFAIINRYELDDSLRFFANSSIVNVDRDLNSFFGDIGREERVETINHAAGATYTTGRRQYYDFSSGLQFQKTKTDDSTVDSHGYDGNISLANGSQQKILFWQLSSSFAEQKNKISDNRNDQSVHDGIFGINLSKTWSVFVQGNQENVNRENQNSITNETWGAGIRLNRPRLSSSLAYNRTEEGSNEKFWSASVNWQPSTRTQFALSYGRRFFGETYSGNLTHRTRRLTQSITISDSVSTFSQSIGRAGLVLCRVNSIGQVDLTSCQLATETTDFSSDLVPVSQVVFTDVSENQTLNRAVSYTLSYQKSKSSFLASLVWNRTKQLNEDLDIQNYRVQKSATLSWLWNASSKTQLNLQARVDQNDDRDNEDDSVDYAPSISVSNRFNQDVRGQLTYTYAKRNADQEGGDFEENRVTLSLQANF